MKLFLLLIAVALTSLASRLDADPGHTEITRWKDGKKAAISITYDDGTINQFRKALPIMNRLGIPATFYIITGNIPGSVYRGKFTGRPVKQIIDETATIPTNKENIYERASAAGFLGLKGTLAYHTRAGALADAGRYPEAFVIIDELYQKVRAGEFQAADNNDSRSGVTWDEIKTYAAQGHEFASHTVTHPYVCVLDEVNALYELEKSKAEIHNQLGARYTFSAEVPYGTEDERAMEFAHKVYPALRNRMPEPFMDELNRASRKNPLTFNKEYVQWQRGTTTKNSLSVWKSWVDTALMTDKIWLVLVIHGVDGIGWEAVPSEALDEYFQYMNSLKPDLWIATFADATKYLRERMHSEVKSKTKGKKIAVTLTHSLDSKVYDIPLTLKTYVPNSWKVTEVKQGKEKNQYAVHQDGQGSYILYSSIPNAGKIEISRR